MSKRIIWLHRKEGDEREENDFYATCPTSIPPLLKLMGWENGGLLIRENSCGQGHLSKALESAGHKVVSTDLIDRGFGVSGVDFLKPSWLDSFSYDAVVMNPPYKHSQAFIERSLGIAPVVCAFLRITFLESEKRRSFFENNPPFYVAVFSKRMRSAKHGDFDNIGSAVVCYAWFVWKRGYKGPTELRWL